MNKEQGDEKQKVPVRQAKTIVWGPVYITLNLEKTPKKQATQTSSVAPEEEKSQSQSLAEKLENKTDEEVVSDESKSQSKKVNVLTSTPDAKPGEEVSEDKEAVQQKQDNSKKVTYVYNLIDHGLDCECIDVKGELLIRSALPTYRKISQGIEFEQVTSNQIKLIITSRVLENYQEVFQGFTQPKATFRVWVIGYKFV
ncbi:MAG: hypothetical protein QNJ31_07275 [Candidatus Caenarcaniphilales bacterium]|nr:hypothetical protein [Candidatus Caenarcaniphilales bacterium]